MNSEEAKKGDNLGLTYLQTDLALRIIPNIARSWIYKNGQPFE